MSVEHLCAILRGDSDDFPPGTDGDDLLRLARLHRVHLLLAWRLPTVRQACVGEVRGEALLDHIKVRELARVTAALQGAGARPVVFKGAALAHTHYAESWLRPRLDADLLIDPGHRAGVFALLGSLGYQRPAFVSGDLVMHQAPFVLTDQTGLEHVLDVHWKVANPHAIADVLSHEEIAVQSRAIDLDGQSCRVPSSVHALVLACVHRASHHDDAEELLWLYDIHRLAEGLEPAEWDMFVELVSARAVRAICSRGLELSLARFHTRAASAVIARLVEDAEIAAYEPSSVYLRKDLRKVDRLAADLQALGPAAGAQLLREHLFPPDTYMEEHYGLTSPVMLPALYLRRVIQGVSKWFRRAS